MSIPKHLMEAKICNVDTCKLANTIPTDDDRCNMIAKLIVETADLQREIERLNNIIKIKTDFIMELLKIIAVARDYELQDKCITRAKLYEEKLQELKGEDK